MGEVTLELAVKTAKQGNVQKMRWASTVGLLQKKKDNSCGDKSDLLP